MTKNKHATTEKLLGLQWAVLFFLRGCPHLHNKDQNQVFANFTLLHPHKENIQNLLLTSDGDTKRAHTFTPVCRRYEIA
jgi:hypothetical protein